MATMGGDDQPSRTREGGFGTRGRLIAAFGALGAAVAAAFALQFARLSRMEKGIAELRDHEEEMHLALELEDLVREDYASRVRALAGEEVQRVAGDGAVERAAARLLASVDEPEGRQLVEELAGATRRLDDLYRADLAAIAEGRVLPRGAEQARFALVVEIETSADRMFAFLRRESVVQSAAVEAIRAESLRLALGFAIALPIFAVAIGFLLSRAIGRPLDALGDGAARVAAGDLRTRIDVRGPAEFAALAAKFNAMAASLEHGQERLVRSEKLAGLGRLAAGIAHEINNPLQVMLGYLSLHRGRQSGEIAEHLARVEREAKRCQEIVEALLQLSRPTSSAPPEPVDLRQISQEVAEAIRVTMPDAPDLRVVGEGEALGSPARYRQVIFNLVKNAVEAAGPRGRVEVEVGCDADTARVVVSDTGPGIPADLRERVFEPFFTTKGEGTGLGLALARAIAQAHGGDVELEAAAPGARFSLRAPRPAEGA